MSIIFIYHTIVTVSHIIITISSSNVHLSIPETIGGIPPPRGEGLPHPWRPRVRRRRRWPLPRRVDLPPCCRRWCIKACKDIRAVCHSAGKQSWMTSGWGEDVGKYSLWFGVIAFENGQLWQIAWHNVYIHLYTNICTYTKSWILGIWQMTKTSDLKPIWDLRITSHLAI